MARRVFVLFLIAAFAFPVIGVFAGGAAEEEAIVLQFPTFWVGTDSKAVPVEELVSEFNQMHEGEIRVQIEPTPDTDGYRQTINTRLAAGDLPDLFIFQPDPTTMQYYEAEDVLMDFADELQDGWGDRFQGSQMEAATVDGMVKSIPYEIGVTPIWYNTRLFYQAGIDEFPTTFGEFWEAAEALKDAGITPTSQMTGGANAWTSMLWYSHIIGSIGGPDAWDRPLDHPQYEQAAEILLQLYSDGNTTGDAVGGDADVSGSHYLAQRTAIFSNGPWYIGRVAGDAPEVHQATQLAPAPAVEGGEHGHQVTFALSNLAAAHTDDPARREAVVKFMQWMTEPDNVAMITEEAGSLFAINYEIDPSIDPLLSEFVRVQNEAPFTLTDMERAFPVAVVQEFGGAIEAMVAGGASPAEFVEILKDAARD